MEKADRQKLKSLIGEETGNIRRHIQELEHRARPVSPDNAIGRLGRMEAIGERGVHQTALAAARQRLHELNQALARIDADEEFGTCERCGEPIPLARLMLMPESRYCVKCLEPGRG